MAETFLERFQSRTEETDESLQESEEGTFGRETNIKFAGVPLEDKEEGTESILTSTPDQLGLSAEQRRASERSEFEEGVREELLGGSGVNSEDLAELIGREVGEADIQRTQVQLLQSITSLLNSILSSNVSQLSTLNSILNSVEPNLSITVTGNNVIENPDVPEPVVPNSADSDVATKVLRIRASTQNDHKIAIGDDSIDPDTGYFLERGESITIPVDLRDQVLYMSSQEAGQSVSLLGMI